jgi:hypothetical protein
MAMVTPIIGVTLGIVALYRMRLERRFPESNNPVNQVMTVSA